MNKLIIPAAAALLVTGAAGGAYIYMHRATPTQNAQALTARGDLRGAQIEWRNVVKAEPGNAEAHAALARLQLQTGDPIAAEKEARAARDLKSDPDATALVLGQSLLAQQRFADVLTEVPAAGSKPEATGQLLVIRSLAQISLKDFVAANASLTEAQRIAPKNAEAVVTSARLAIAQNNLPEAEARVDRALTLEPDRTDTLVLKGQLAAARGDRPAALTYMDKAINLAPTVMALRTERVSLLLQAGQEAKARADVDAVLAKEPRNPVASYYDLVLLVRASKFTEADAVLTKLAPVLARFPRGPYFEAVVKAGLNQNESAADAAARYVARSPGDPDGVRLLARIELAARRPDRAIAALVKATDAGMNDAETLDMLGRAYALDGKVPLAVEAFQKASNLAPDDPTILTRLASSKLQLGDTSGATSTLERSLDLAPKQVNAGEALVGAALAEGDADKAQAALDRMRQQVGDTEAVGMLDGLVKLARRDIEGARARFADVAQRFPQSTMAPVNLAKTMLLLGKPADAEAVLRAALAKTPGEPQALNQLVAELVRQDKVPEAVAAVQAARAAAPGNLALTAAVADLQVRAKEPRAALATLEEARAAANGVMPTQLLPAQSRAQIANADVEGGKATLKRYVAANPQDLEALRALVELLVNNNDMAGAKEMLDEGLRASPGNLGMMQAMILIETKFSGLNAAVAKADELRRNPANLPAAGVLKGDAYMTAQRFGDAAAAFTEEAKARPSTALTMRLAGALISSGGQDQAAGTLRTWLAQHADDTDVLQMLASMDINAHRLPDAETHLKALLAKRPNDAIALNNLAWVYQQRGNPDALTMARRAYLLSPTTESADTLGWILATKGDTAGLPLLQQASNARPADPTLRYHLAVALDGAGQRGEAVKLLETLAAEPAPFDDKAAAKKLLDQLKSQK